MEKNEQRYIPEGHGDGFILVDSWTGKAWMLSHVGPTWVPIKDGPAESEEEKEEVPAPASERLAHP